MKNTFKTPLIIVFLFIISNLNGQNKTSIIIYKKNLLVKLNESKSNNADAKKILQKSIIAAKELEYELVFNHDESFFSEIEKLDSDNSNMLSNRLARLMGFGVGEFYMNIKENKIIVQRNLSSDLFLIESKIESQKWKKTSETKQIAKYTCFKATTTVLEETVSAGTVEKEVIAWFTPEIPAPFGPAGFGGLPGLIMEIEKDNAVLYAYKVYLGTNKDKEIKIPKRGIKVSKEEFREIQKKGSAYYRQYKN